MLSKREWAWGYLLIAPMALGLAVFYLWPILQTLYLSFTESGVFGGYTWVGTANYAGLLGDEDMAGALGNTLLYAVLVLAGVPLSIVVAALLNVPGLRGLSVYRTLYFLPVVTMPAAVGLTWRYLFNGDFGAINHLLGLVGIDGPYWMGDPDVAIYAIAIVGVWSSIGYNAVLFLAGLQGIPRHYYEAASIDGAGRLRQFFRITLPLLTPTTFFVVVITMINALQVFDLVYLMIDTTSPALRGSRTIVYLFFEKAFVHNQRGLAAAIAVLLLGLILVLTAIQFRLQKKWVHYE
ncbi:carbohydrate ABC transporter permease [Nonomuraea gerenzanensis]|uniref:N-Acetyl-D-glucosamine ABC transport system, permease protein 1 n=1 Tax=Nonomuraea gerenzanensis TaxID=93944 RepID=A0A1M4E6I9_9ACTN|nr:sugar ABC transporter permease [Nonomuraea gerenzanensis]UBU16586.1 sugar ABC transporter permease [Nonomuraea gerenzanensis]SBO94413.1 N-Acetyl-D-glucosamine ABC transport system, permease protein 1 [Nonomuraea gerenzanensis]